MARTHVLLGNPQPVTVRVADDGSTERSAVALPEDADHAVTHVVIPDGKPLGEAFADVTAQGGVWGFHSDADRPAWVSSSSEGLANLLGEHFGCEVRAYEPPDPPEAAGMPVPEPTTEPTPAAAPTAPAEPPAAPSA